VRLTSGSSGLDLGLDCLVESFELVHVGRLRGPAYSQALGGGWLRNLGVKGEWLAGSGGKGAGPSSRREHTMWKCT
jgi:hypothetical protein